MSDSLAPPLERELARVTADSIVTAMIEAAETTPARPLLRFLDANGAEETFDAARIREAAARHASLLTDAGIEPGDLVLLLFPDSASLVGAFLGTAGLGAVPAIYPLADTSRRVLDPAAIRRIVESIGFRAVLAPEDPASPAAAAGCPVIRVPGGEDRRGEARFAFRIPAAEDPAFLQLSSGTTGPPKGILLSHRAVMAYATSVVRALQIPPDGVSVGWIPLFHDMGLVTHLLIPILAGTFSVHIPTGHWLRHPESLFGAVHRYRATMTWMPNFAFRYCARHVRDEQLEGLDLACWRVVGNGSEPAQADAMEEFIERFAPAGLQREALMVGYGFAENVCGATLTPLESEPAVDWVSLHALEVDGRAVPAPARSPGSRAVVSCGFPRSGVEIRVAGPDGRLMPERRVGRILVRSTSLFTRYLGNGSGEPPVDGEGWFRSGDLGYLASGELYVCGRESDLIIVAGRNLHPEPLEAIASRELGAAAGRTVAFAIRDASTGTEAPLLVCECKGLPDDPDRDRLRQRIREAVHEQTGVSLADVRFVSKGWIVRTTSGKTARRACQRKYLEERTEELHLEAPAATDLMDLVERRLRIRPIALDDDLCALADSLQLTSLLLEVESHVGRPLSWDAFFRDPTLARLLEATTVTGPPGGTTPRKAKPDRPHGARRRRARRKLRSARKSAAVTILRHRNRLPFLRDALLGGDAALLRRFYALLVEPVQDIEEFLTRASIAERLTRLGRAEGLLSIRGLPHLGEALEGPSGIVFLHSHFGAYRTAARHLTDVVQRDSMSLRKSGIVDLTAGGARYDVALVDRTLTGRRMLEARGVVHIAGDGRQGRSAAREFPLHGRSCTFRAGFAYLAEESGAVVLPVFSSLDMRGAIEIEVGVPLEATGDSSEARVAGRISAYVQLLAEKWRADAAQVPRSIMRDHADGCASR